MACDDVLSIERLQISSKHDIFHNEVITGKVGGTGADIDYATNQVTGQTQKTLPAVLRDAGFRPAPFTFASGGSLAVGDSDMAVLWPAPAGGDGQYYIWKGSYPKTIPGSSSPASTGGVSDSGWLPLGDITLRSELSGVDGVSMVGSASYADIRAYAGDATVINVYGRVNVFDGAFGAFIRDPSDTTSADNGGTILVDGLGRRWKRKYTHSVNLLWFADQNSPDCYAGIMAAYEFAKSTDYRAIYAPPGTWTYSSTLDFDSPMFKIHGDGRFNTVFHYTGSGVAMQFTDANPNHGTYAYGGQIEDFGVRGTASATGLIRVKYVHHFNAKNINLLDASPTVGYGLRLEGVVSGYWENIVCSVNAQLMSSRPFNGIVVDREATTQAMSTNNTFVNVIIEGMAGDGVALLGSEQSTFTGGTSEANFGNGMTVLFGCRENTFIGMAFEQNHHPTSYADVSDAGYASKYINCYTGKVFIFEPNSLFGSLDGGVHQSISDNGSFNEISNVQYSFFVAGGTFTFNNTSTCKNIYNKQANAIEFKKAAIQSVSLTGSPFTYTNGSGLDEQISVEGGTVQSIKFNRDGLEVFVPINTSITLKPQDKLIISYTVAPLIGRIPV